MKTIVFLRSRRRARHWILKSLITLTFKEYGTNSTRQIPNAISTAFLTNLRIY